METNLGEDPSVGGEGESLHFQHFTVPVVDGHPVELGRGAMGITYKAYDRNLHIHVALKVINGAVLTSESARERFLREARSAAALRHPNVAAVFYLGEQEGSVFYAMEYVEGETIEAWIRRDVGMPPALALEIVAQVASALAAAQKEGIIHRDIKPSNIMLTKTDDGGVEVKVIDFGLAKSIETTPDSATVTLTQGGFLGTPHFASPEQLEEGEVDTRSDIYSLGVTLFYMLAGKTPFSGSMAQVMSQHLYRQPPLELLENQPAVVMDLLASMLAKRPEDRPQTAMELRKRVEACLKELEFMGPAGDPLPSLAPGHIVGGRFTLQERMGNAGEFVRFRASDALQPGTPVEVVMADPATTPVAGLRDEVRRRVSVVEHLDAPAIRKVIAQEGTGRGWFFAVEAMQGVTLLQLMKSRRSLPLAEAMLILKPIADAADAFDRARAPRPDLAPHEILLAPAGDLTEPLSGWPALVVKIDALRIERFLDAPADVTVVQSSSAVLSRDAGGEIASAAAAVAALAYEVLGGTRLDALHDHWTPLAELTQEGNLVIRRALESGFPSAAEFVEALAGEGTTTMLRERSPSAVPELPPLPVEWETKPAVRSRTPMIPAVVLLIVAAVFAFGIFLLRPHSRPQPPVVVAPTASPSPAATPLVVSEPNQTPTPPATDPKREAYAEELAKARELEAGPDDAAALGAYAKLVAAHPDDTELLVALKRIATKIETDRPEGVKAEELPALRPALEAAGWLGSESAQTLLGNALFETEPTMSLRWLEMAAKQGRSDAMVKAGKMLSNARGVPVHDYRGAARWFQAAVERNDPEGMVFLADCYLRGLGVTADPKHAAELLTTATALGDNYAMNVLGRLYEKGNGVGKSDPAKAMELWRKASSLGNLDAQANLGVLYINGEGVARDPVEAMRLWKDGAEKGNLNCMVFYAQSLEDQDVGNDPKQAREWFLKAARSGDKDAVEWCKEHDVSITDTAKP